MGLENIFNGNKQWQQDVTSKNPDFFEVLSKGQSPEYLWIGCSDSRVPPTQLTGMNPGNLFVHRNIANMVVKDDLNLTSVIYYAVMALKVPNIVVCGHYGCGGVQGAMGDLSYGPMDPWLAHIKEVKAQNNNELDAISNEQDKFNRLVELNTLQQAKNISEIGFVAEEISKGSGPKIHALVYDLATGLLKDLG